MARGSRDAHAAMGVRARLGAAPRAARNWASVRPLLPAWPGASAVVFLAFLTRPAGGVAGEWPSELPNGHPSHHTTFPGTGCGLGAVPQSPSCPKGGWARNFPNTVPSAHHRFRTTLERRPLAPPARAIHSCRPFALPARVARSRRPLAPQPALTGTRPSWSVSISQYRPICTPPFMPPACAARSARPREAESTSGAQGIVQAGATSRKHSVLPVLLLLLASHSSHPRPTLLRMAARLLHLPSLPHANGRGVVHTTTWPRMNSSANVGRLSLSPCKTLGGGT